MTILSRLLELSDRLSPPTTVRAHCDLPCGVYDPAQARIEAESVKGIQQKYQDSDDPVFRERAIQIKEERADLVKRVVAAGEAGLTVAGDNPAMSTDSRVFGAVPSVLGRPVYRYHPPWRSGRVG